MIDALKRIEKIILKNAFEQKKWKPRLKFNPGLALIDLRTTGPWSKPWLSPDLELQHPQNHAISRVSWTARVQVDVLQKKGIGLAKTNLKTMDKTMQNLQHIVSKLLKRISTGKRE